MMRLYAIVLLLFVNTLATSENKTSSENVKITLEPSLKLLVSWDPETSSDGSSTFKVVVKSAKPGPSKKCDQLKAADWSEAGKSEDNYGRDDTVSWDSMQWQRGLCYQAFVTASSHKGNRTGQSEIVQSIAPPALKTYLLGDKERRPPSTNSLPLNQRTEAANPGKSISAKAVVKSSSSIQATWTLNPANESADYFVVTLSNLAGKVLSRHESFNNESSYVWTKLEPYTKYVITAFAVNVVDDNPVQQGTEPITVTTWADTPSVPKDFRENKSKRSATAITLEWFTPKVTNGPIDGYQMEYIENFQSTTPGKEVSFAATNSYTLNGLRPYRSYSFSLRAFNTVNGIKLYSEKTETIECMTNEGSPSPVGSVTLELFNTGETRVTWKTTSPIVGITAYRVRLEESKEERTDQYCPTEYYNYNTVQRETVNAWSSTFTYLKDWTKKRCYYAFVAVSTGAGDSSEVKSNTVQLRLRKSSEPLDVIVTDHNESSIEISWTAPKRENGLASYEVRCEDDWENWVYAKALDSKNRSHICTGLKPYTKYYINVLARNSDAPSDPSKTLEFLTEVATPTVPTEIKLESINASSLRASWKKPEPANGPIDKYVVKFSGKDGEQLLVLNGNVLNHTFEKLSPYTEYNLTVAAVNELKKKQLQGPEGSQSAFTRVSAPSEPVGLKTSKLAATQMTVKWSKPAVLNGPSPAYELSYVRLESHKGDPEIQPIVLTKTAEPTLEMKSLMPYRKYKVTVRAFNVDVISGESLSGSSVEIYVTTASAVPSAPNKVKLTLLPSRKVLVEWDLVIPKTGPTTFTIEVKSAQADPNVECEYFKNWTTTRKMENYGEWDTVSWDRMNWESGKCYQAFVTASTEGKHGKTVASEILKSSDPTKAPRNVRIVDTTKDSVTVEWDEPETEAKTLHVDFSYKVSCSGKREVIEYAEVHEQEQRKYTCQGLTPFVNYHITVVAITVDTTTKNEVLGIPSEIIVQKTKATKPGKTVFDDVLTGLNSIEVTWRKPAEPNGPIDYYVLTLSDEDGSEVAKYQENGGKTSYLWTKLKPHTNYVASIFAVNVVDGEALQGVADRKEAKTSNDNKTSGPVQNIKVTQITSFEANISWDPPLQSSGLIDNYEVLLNGQLWSSDLKRDARKITISDLKPYTKYTVVVYAVRKGEVKLEGERHEVIFSTPVSNPGMILNLKATANPDSLALTWEPPSNPSGPIDYYKVTLENRGPRNVTNSRTTFENLKADSLYEASVTAVNILQGRSLSGETVTQKFKTTTPSGEISKDIKETKAAKSMFLSFQFFAVN